MNQWLDTPEGRAAVDQIGSGLEALGAGLRQLAAAAQKQAPSANAASEIPQERAVGLLMRRLGPENQRFLWAVVQDYKPGEVFSLEEMARAAGISKESARARLMNIGRSLKNLGSQAPFLWEVTWDETENAYEWDYDAHRALMKLGGL